MGNRPGAFASNPPELVRTRRPRDTQRIPLRGGDVMQRRSPARRVRRGLLPGAGSPRTATLVSLHAESAALPELPEAVSRAPRENPPKCFYDHTSTAPFAPIPQLPEHF